MNRVPHTASRMHPTDALTEDSMTRRGVLTHVYHGEGVDLHVDGLQDGCERCLQLAEHPFEGLDDRMLQMMAWRIVNNDVPRSDAENLALYRMRGAKRLLDAVRRG